MTATRALQRVTVPAQSGPGLRWVGRTDLELLADQLAAIAAWHRMRHAAEEAAAGAVRSRELRLDLTRQADARKREHSALVARTEQQLRAGDPLTGRRMRPRALLVHRNAWLRDKVGDELARHGVDVLGRLDDGAEAVGWVVAEQPDVLLVEDMLPTLPGVEVVRRTRELSPRTLVAAQVGYDDGARPMLDAGARTAYSRRVPPADVARGIVELVTAAG